MVHSGGNDQTNDPIYDQRRNRGTIKMTLIKSNRQLNTSEMSLEKFTRKKLITTSFETCGLVQFFTADTSVKNHVALFGLPQLWMNFLCRLPSSGSKHRHHNILA